MWILTMPQKLVLLRQLLMVMYSPADTYYFSLALLLKAAGYHRVIVPSLKKKKHSPLWKKCFTLLSVFSRTLPPKSYLRAQQAMSVLTEPIGAWLHCGSACPDEYSCRVLSSNGFCVSGPDSSTKQDHDWSMSGLRMRLDLLHTSQVINHID